MTADFLLYGSTGYVGRAIAELAVERGLRPVLGGRRAEAVGHQAAELGLDFVVASAGDAASLEAAMGDVPLVLSCAGPFVHTVEPLVEACLGTNTHYLDISGEPPVYDAVAARHEQAEAASVMLLPSVGFDVVATDCLAGHLMARLPNATRLTLALHQEGPADLPPGTLRTVIEMAPYGSSKQHRVGGEVVSAKRRMTRLIDFGDGPVEASMITWGDVFTAYVSTGVPNIADYTVMSPELSRQLDLLDRVRPLLRWGPVRNAAKKTLRGGATSEERAQTTMAVWGEVIDTTGEKAVSRLFGPEGGLEWTSRAALDVVGHALAGEVKPGFQTPATAYGPDLVLEAEGVTREDVE